MWSDLQFSLGPGLCFEYSDSQTGHQASHGLLCDFQRDIQQCSWGHFHFLVFNCYSRKERSFSFVSIIDQFKQSYRLLRSSCQFLIGFAIPAYTVVLLTCFGKFFPFKKLAFYLLVWSWNTRTSGVCVLDRLLLAVAESPLWRLEQSGKKTGEWPFKGLASLRWTSMTRMQACRSSRGDTKSAFFSSS